MLSLGVEPEKAGFKLHKALGLLLCNPSHAEKPGEPCPSCMEIALPLVMPVARAICSAAGHNRRQERPKFLPMAGRAVEELFLDAMFLQRAKT